MEGEALLERFDLGHEPGTTVTKIALSPSQENHFVASADDSGTVRVHSIKIIAEKKDKSNATAEAGDAGADADEAKAEKKPKKDNKDEKRFVLTTNFSTTFTLPPGSAGEEGKLNALLPVDRGSQIYFLTGDSLGRISVFFRNGTIKGRVRVTEDPGGVSGLLRAQGQSVLFFSSHTFGFFSASQIDVQYAPCSGWNSPLFDIAVDPTNAYSRVVLALADGSGLVFSTSRGKSKGLCELSVKFPHVSILRGHILGLQVAPDEPGGKEYLREVYFFNMAAMDAGYGASHSRAVTLQASFKPKQPVGFALFGAPSVGASDRSKSQIALRFEDIPGVELFELNLKQPAAAKGKSGGAGGAFGATSGFGGESDSSSWLNNVPKIGVFGIALIGVVIWNVRKVTSQRQHDKMDDIDEDYLKKIRERRKLGMDKKIGNRNADPLDAPSMEGLDFGDD
eukprot:CAMPEP_0117546744 /NCGR_PEP_ID=MMETSP0784-20121206/46763_1 /TAXON_ID=39447 /ORGANISM="" /LENGTH=450 /DNA_ID=CAMNT_0005343621 /DNA_START=1 /DNA_END=1350 /DNA_ORIENTATION=+